MKKQYYNFIFYLIEKNIKYLKIILFSLFLIYIFIAFKISTIDKMLGVTVFFVIPLFLLLVMIIISVSHFWYISLFYFNLDKINNKSKQEKDELSKKFKEEFNLSFNMNNNVIIEELPTYIEVKKLCKEQLSLNIQQAIHKHNKKIIDTFNDLDTYEKELIYIEEYKIHKMYADEYTFKEESEKLENKFNKKIKSVKQKLLFNK